MIFKENANELILQDKSGWSLLFKMICVAVAVIFVGAAIGGFDGFERIPKSVIPVGAFLSAILIGFGVWHFASHPAPEIVINPQTKTVSFKRRGVFKKSDKIYAFDQINEFFVRQDEDEDNRPISTLR